MKKLWLLSTLLVVLLIFFFVRNYANKPKSSNSKEYIVVESNSRDRLAIQVNSYLSNRYQLQGGVSSNNGVYLQAMVREGY